MAAGDVIGLSMLLVIMAAVALVVGLFAGQDLTLIWTSIALCLAAALFLLIGVLRLCPRGRAAAFEERSRSVPGSDDEPDVQPGT